MKTKILVHSWHTPESSGGFDWVPTSDAKGCRSLIDDWRHDGAEHSIIVEFFIAGYQPGIAGAPAREAITDYIDEVLLDLIEQGQIGRIIARHDNDNEPNRLAQEGS